MAKRSSSPSISLALPFPDKTAECGVSRREANTFYMHCELDKGEMHLFC